MRSLVAFTLALAALVAGCAHSCPPGPAARPFAMRTYYMALLYRGPAWTAEETEASKALGDGHMAHIRAMGESGKLLIAGPFDQPPEAAHALAGIFLFDVPSIEEARALAEDDPAVKAGRLLVEVVPWYGPVGLTYDGRKPPAAKTP
jgi:uncharacterized protein YciI